MTREEITSKLATAAYLLSEVYQYAGKNGLQELEHLMSVADTCIVEAYDAIELDLMENQ